MTTVWITSPEPLPGDVIDLITHDLGVRPVLEKSRSFDQVPADVVVATATGMFLTGLVEHFGAEAGNRLTRALGRLRRRSPASTGDVRLVDDVSGVAVHLDGAAADDDRAVRSLLDLELAAFQPGVELRWDAGEGRWRPRPTAY